MARKSPKFTVEQIPGDKYKSLEEAWSAPLHPGSKDTAKTLLAKMMVDTVKRLLETGELVSVQGKLVPGKDKIQAAKQIRELENQKRFIYALIDPRDNTIRYVGQTNNTGARLNSHLFGGGVKTLKTWIGELKSLKLHPNMEILQETTSEKVNAAEKEWIKRLSQNSTLLNTKHNKNKGA